MTAKTVEIPDELLSLLEEGRLGALPFSEQVRISLAVRLFQEGVISVGKAAELAGEPRIAFEQLLTDMGVPPARYDVADYEADLRGLEAARQRASRRRTHSPGSHDRV